MHLFRGNDSPIVSASRVLCYLTTLVQGLCVRKRCIMFQVIPVSSSSFFCIENGVVNFACHHCLLNLKEWVEAGKIKKKNGGGKLKKRSKINKKKEKRWRTEMTKQSEGERVRKKKEKRNGKREKTGRE